MEESVEMVDQLKQKGLTPFEAVIVMMMGAYTAYCLSENNKGQFAMINSFQAFLHHATEMYDLALVTKYGADNPEQGDFVKKSMAAIARKANNNDWDDAVKLAGKLAEVAHESFNQELLSMAQQEERNLKAGKKTKGRKIFETLFNITSKTEGV